MVVFMLSVVSAANCSVRIQGTLGPQCDAVTCMPDPTTSAYWSPWRGRRFDKYNNDVMVARGLEAAEKVRLHGGYYSRRTDLALTLCDAKVDGAIVAGGAPQSVPLLSYKAARRKKTVPVRFGNMGPCRRAHAFVFPSTFHIPTNLFHLFADTLLPVASAVRGACGGLRCAMPAELWLNDFKTYKQANNSERTALPWLRHVLDLVFDGRVRALPQRECVAKLTWGKGPSPAYDDATHAHTALVADIRALLDEKFGTARARRNFGDPVVVHVERHRFTDRDHRYLEAEAAIALDHAFGGVAACCPFGDVAAMWTQLRQADIVYALHGAGQVNVLFATQGAVLVQLYGAKGWEATTCRRFASAVKGGYVRAPVKLASGRPEPFGHVLVDPKQAAIIAQCAIAVWRAGFLADADEAARRVAVACFPDDSTVFVTEAWSAHHNRVLRPPPNDAM